MAAAAGRVFQAFGHGREGAVDLTAITADDIAVVAILADLLETIAAFVPLFATRDSLGHVAGIIVGAKHVLIITAEPLRVSSFREVTR